MGTVVDREQVTARADVDRLSPQERNALARVEGGLFAPGGRPTTLERYELLERVGAGGGGTVWRARDLGLDRIVAVKLLSSRSTAARSLQARLRREAKAIARLSHPNVVSVFDVGEYAGSSGDGVFIVMEFVDGDSLSAWLQSAERSTSEILGVFEEVARGLQAVHDVGFVHRDLKPGNVLVGRDGRVRVADFGLVGADSIAVASGTTAQGTVLDSVTRTGTVMGTPAYMAPEQHRGADVDARADQYGFAVSMFRALFDGLPFQGSTLEELYQAKLLGPPGIGRGTRSVPRRVRRALRRMLQPEPTDRFASMVEVLEALRPRGRVLPVLAAATLCVLGASAWSVDSREPCDEVARAEADRAWGPRVQERVRTSVREAGGDEESAEHVATQVGEHSDAWIVSRARVCEAARNDDVDPSVLDARQACLAERRRSLEAAVAVLDGAPAWQNAAELLRGLRTPAACSTLDEPQPWETTEPAARDSVEAIEREVARADALLKVGDAEQALALTQKAASDAAELGAKATESRALRVTAAAHNVLGDKRLAYASFEAAFAASVSGGDDVGALHAAASIADRAVDSSDLLRARHWLREAESMFQRRTMSLFEEFRVLHARARLYEHESRFDDALALRRRMTELWEQEEPESLHAALAYQLLGVSEAEAGNFRAAIGPMTRAVELREAILGPQHMQLVGALVNLAGAHVMLGELEEGRHALERAHAIVLKHRGPRSAEALEMQTNLGNVYQATGRLEQAEDAYRAALRYHRDNDPFGAEVGHALAQLGRIVGLQGDNEGAAQHAREALVVLEGAIGVDHPRIARPMMQLAEAEYELEQLQQAEKHTRRVLEILDATEQAPKGHAIYARALLGRILLDRGKAESAVAVLEPAVADARDPSLERSTLARPAFALALARRATGADRSDAIALATEALSSIEDEPSPVFARLRAEITDWLDQHGKPLR